METKAVNKKKLLEVLVITLFLTYGIHYFGYFIRVRYFNLLAPLIETNPGLYSIFRYLGHLIFWGMFAIYCFAVKGERKYFEAFLPGKGNNKISKLFIGMLIGFAMNAICVFGAVLHGDITISGTKSFNVGLFILAFFAVLIQASQEELESRVFFFGKLKEGGFPFGAAMILSGTFFAYLHATNPGFGIIPFISLAWRALFIFSYTFTRGQFGLPAVCISCGMFPRIIFSVCRTAATRQVCRSSLLPLTAAAFSTILISVWKVVFGVSSYIPWQRGFFLC